MDDLTLVGVHDDGEHLLLTSPSGQRFRLRVDEAVRAAVRRDRARLSQIQVETEGRLRPREIQARIRAGESAESVAESANLSLEHVQRYEGPVLAERAYVADQAREVRVRRASSPTRSLDELVREHLGPRGVDLDELSWDAWRAEDGSWTVALTWPVPSGEQTAKWTYTPNVRHVVPQDDEATKLVAEEEAAPSVPQRRLAPVRDRVFDVDAVARQEEAAVDLLDTLAQRRGRRNRPLTEEEEIGGAPDPVREAIDSLLSRSDTRTELGRAAELVDAPPAQRTRKAPRNAPDVPIDAHEHEVLVLPDVEEPVDEGHDEPVEHEEVPAGRGGRNSRRPRRASVPSWDDIVFGQRRD
ncbi:septation protein SepH [Spongisporangium articulatum]|uniref:Septation protein SepH n=1 Tax=Spongisporangium articulatum TaxID=3362603 RepID=A0ABW8AS94_9ACTN